MKIKNLSSNSTLIVITALIAILIVLAIGLILIIGAPPVALSNKYAFVYLLGCILAITGLLILFNRPMWAVYAALIVILLPRSFIPVDINSLLNRAATLVALFVWALTVFIQKRRIHLPVSSIIMLIFILWCGCSLYWASSLDTGLTAFQMYIMRFVLFMVVIVNTLKSLDDLIGLMNILAVSGGLLITISIVQVIIGGYVSGTRLQILEMNENTMGVYLIMFTPPVLWWASRANQEQRIFRRIIATIYMILSIALIGMSGSRGSALSLGIMMLAFLAWKSSRIWGTIGVSILLIAVILAPFVLNITINRFLGSTNESLLTGREYIWPAGVQLIGDHPLIGVGVGNSDYEVIPYLKNLGFKYTPSGEGESLHNPLLTVFAEMGLPGFLLYLGMLLSAMWSFIKMYRYSYLKNYNDTLRQYYPLIAAAFLGYTVSWIKGGGMEVEYSCYIMLVLLIAPLLITREAERPAKSRFDGKFTNNSPFE